MRGIQSPDREGSACPRLSSSHPPGPDGRLARLSVLPHELAGLDDLAATDIRDQAAGFLMHADREFLCRPIGIATFPQARDMAVVELDLAAAQRRVAFGVFLTQLIQKAGAPRPFRAPWWAPAGSARRPRDRDGRR